MKRKHDDLTVMKDPGLWPKGPVPMLGLKHKRRKSRFKYGYILADDFTVYRVGRPTQTEMFKSAEELVEAGWVVD